MQPSKAAPTYIFDQHDAEYMRLARQAAYLRVLTRGTMIRAGVQPGMRVLDFGAGSGEVSVLAAELVGPTGEVVALERLEGAASRAEARLAAAGLGHARVVVGDERMVGALAGEGGFDAIVGRLVLVHQPDPAATIALLAQHLRPGGVMAFHECEIDAPAWSTVPLPLLAQVWRWIEGFFVKGKLPRDIGRRMADGFVRAGMQDALVLHEGLSESGPDAGAYGYLAITIGTALPILERLGVTTAAEVQIETLEARLRAEAVEANATLIPAYFAVGCARKPS